MSIRSSSTAFHAAEIWTADQGRGASDTLLIEDGLIAAVGRADEIVPRAGRVVRLEGGTILPGFIDIHTHALEGGRVARFELQLSPAASFDSLLETIERACGAPNHHGWLIGHGWGAGCAEFMATADGLRAVDAASGSVPILLRDVSYHSRLVNSAALERAGITPTTPDPEGGVIVRDPTSGTPTGLLHETAGSLLDAAAPAYSHEDNVEAARRSVDILNSYGITGFGHAVASRSTLEAFGELDRKGKLNARMAAFLDSGSVLSLQRDGIGPELIQQRADYASRHIATDFAKFFMDGVPSMGTASFFRDRGTQRECAPFYSCEELASLIGSLDRDGVSVKIHAVGDRAISDVLDAIDRVRARNPNGPIHQIAHLSFIRPQDVERLAELRVVADLCPPMWFPSHVQQHLRTTLGDELVEQSWPIRTMLQNGVLATAGSDWPCVSLSPNPWPGLAALMTRRNSKFPDMGVHRPDQRLELEDALRMYTINAARAVGIARHAGSLTPGKSADFMILSDDIFSMAAEELEQVKVAATYFEGRLVHGAIPEAAERQLGSRM